MPAARVDRGSQDIRAIVSSTCYRAAERQETEIRAGGIRWPELGRRISARRSGRSSNQALVRLGHCTHFAAFQGFPAILASAPLRAERIQVPKITKAFLDSTRCCVWPSLDHTLHGHGRGVLDGFQTGRLLSAGAARLLQQRTYKFSVHLSCLTLVVAINSAWAPTAPCMHH